MTQLSSPVKPSSGGSSSQRVVLGICGGVGPAAGLLLHQLILQHTESGGDDQGHLPVCHMSRSDDITDRTEFLQQQYLDSDASAMMENPACGMARTFAMVQAAVAAGAAADDDDSHTRLVTGVPCNTFHARPIWDEFLRLTGAKPPPNAIASTHHVHMLEETARFIAQYAPTSKRIGLLATTGTRASRAYHDLLEPMGFCIIEVDGCMQQELHESIYNRSWGIKSTAPVVSSRCRANFKRYVRHLRQEGAQVIVLGCTEIPFVFAGKTNVEGVLLIDPMVALARAMIRQADVEKLKPLELEGAPVTPLAKLPCLQDARSHFKPK